MISRYHQGLFAKAGHLAGAVVLTTSVGVASAQSNPSIPSGPPMSPLLAPSSQQVPNSNDLFPNSPAHPSQGGPIAATSSTRLFDNLADDDPNKETSDPGDAISPFYEAGNPSDDGPVVGTASDPGASNITLPEGEVMGDIAEIRTALQDAPDVIGLYDANAAPKTARVIVTLRPPIGTNMLDQSARVARAPEVESAIAGTGSSVETIGDALGFMVLEVTSTGLEALLQTDAVGALELDKEWPLMLSSSKPVTGADVTYDQGLRGDGDGGNGEWETVIVDTGVRKTHQKFSGKVVAEACYTITANCPNGLNTMVGVGAGVPCNDGGGCFHGTHVAGIAAASNAAASSARKPGYAAEADIVAVQVFDTDLLTRTSSINSALNFALARRNAGNRVASVNLSLGGGRYFSACDTTSPSTTAAVDALRAAGVLVVAAAGNDGYRDSMGWPACITGMFSVGSTTDSDAVSSFSNAASFMDVWAPGSNIYAPTYTSDTAYTSASGTSMASPAVAGAAAALYDCLDWPDTSGNTSPPASFDDSAAWHLRNRGQDVSDGRSGGTVTKDRLDLLNIATRYNANNTFANRETHSGATGQDVDYNVCSTQETGEPSPGSSSRRASTWHEWTAPGTGVVEFTTCDAYTNFDTYIGLYRGNGPLNLTEIGRDDDDGTCTHSTRHSRLAIPVTSGESVKIGVYGFSALHQGKYRLKWDYTPDDTVLAGTTLISPINGASTGINPEYEWERVTAASHYRLWVQDTTGVVISNWYSSSQASCTASGCSVTPAIQVAPGAVNWDVQTWNGSVGAGSWAGVETFTASTAAPAKPTMVYPLSGNTLTDSTPSYYWTAVPGATRYRLYVYSYGASALVTSMNVTAENANCSPLVAGRCSYLLNVPHADGAIRWWIGAWNSLGFSGWQGPQTYTMDSTATVIGKGLPLAPLPGYSIPSNPPEFTWNAHAGASHYYLYTRDPSGVVRNEIMTAASVGCASSSAVTCSATPPSWTLASGSNARWWIRNYRPAGGWGVWSSPFFFDVP